MGYQGRVDWTDMSDYVVHFTKPVPVEEIPRPGPTDPHDPNPFASLAQLLYEQRVADRTGYTPWIDILGPGHLRVGDKPLGAARFVPEVRDLHRSSASARSRWTCSTD